jgi:hypothetical protein
MSEELVSQLGPAYLRLQADRCRRLSQSCMDLGTAKNLRLMSEEYFAEATKLDAARPGARLAVAAAPLKIDRRAH